MMEELKRGLIIVSILIGVSVLMAAIGTNYWIIGDYRSVALYVGIIFVLFGLIIFAYRYTMFPDKGVENHE